MPIVPRMVAVLVAAMSLGVVLGSPHLPIIEASQHDQGRPGPTAVGVEANPHQLPPPPPGAPVRERPRLYPVDQATFGLMKAQANAAAAAAEHRPEPPGEGVAPTAGFPTLDIGQTGGWNPPDGALAVGPTSLLVALNEAFAFYDRAGKLRLGPVSFQAFFGNTQSIFDPRALYDAGHGRFVLLTTTMNSGAGTSAYMLGVSKSSSPEIPSTGGWCTYSLNAVTGSGGSAAWADFPGLGMDGLNLYITSNQFGFNTGFLQTRMLVVPKATVYPDAAGSCGTATSTDFQNLPNPDGGQAFTVQPAHQPDAPVGQAGTMYLVNAIWAAGDKLALRAVTPCPSPANTPCLNAPFWVSVASYNLPADAPQPKGPAVDTGDTRLATGAVQRSGQIYTANTTRQTTLSSTANSNANAQWYRINPNGPTSSFALANRNVAFYFPGVVPASTFVGGQVSGSGSNQPASAYFFRGGAAPTRYQAGVAGYLLHRRWGDYPGVSTDPTDSTKVWVLGEYAKFSFGWGTAVTSIQP